MVDVIINCGEMFLGMIVQHCPVDHVSVGCEATKIF